MPSTCSERQPPPGHRRTRSGLATLTAVLAPMLACTYTPAPAFPRPPLPLDPAVRARYQPPANPGAPRFVAAPGGVVYDGELCAGDETIRFHLFPAADKERPLVLLVPILAGGDDLMRTLARRFVARGFHAAFCERAGPALRPPQRGRELERLFQRTVIHQRLTLECLRRRPEIAPSATFACGISLGGMVTSVLAAVEPTLDGAAICLAGADLPSILLDSAESRIETWRAWRRTNDGLAGSPLRDELARSLWSDPLHLAPCVAADRVLMVATDFDEVVRPRHQRTLWEALGRPQRLSLPLGHYSAALALDSIVDAIADFFTSRLPR